MLDSKTKQKAETRLQLILHIRNINPWNRNYNSATIIGPIYNTKQKHMLNSYLHIQNIKPQNRNYNSTTIIWPIYNTFNLTNQTKIQSTRFEFILIVYGVSLIISYLHIRNIKPQNDKTEL